MKVREFMILEDRYYTQEHEWIKIEDNGVRIGITDYAQNSLHEIVYIDLPEREVDVERMNIISTAESVKAVSDLVAPISGTVEKVNEEIQSNPEILNEDPFEKGWLL